MKTDELIERLREKNKLNEFVTVCSKEEIKEIIEKLEEHGELRERTSKLIKDWLGERRWRLAQDETLKVIENIIKA